MKPSERIVTEIPVSEMWNSEGPVEARRVGLLSRECGVIRESLRREAE
jgi:hypothetical protein